jgi:hypothetical protein
MANMKEARMPILERHFKEQVTPHHSSSGGTGKIC